MEQGHWNFVAVAKTEEQGGAEGQTVLADLKARYPLLVHMFLCLLPACASCSAIKLCAERRLNGCRALVAPAISLLLGCCWRLACA